MTKKASCQLLLFLSLIMLPNLVSAQEVPATGDIDILSIRSSTSNRENVCQCDTITIQYYLRPGNSFGSGTSFQFQLTSPDNNWANATDLSLVDLCLDANCNTHATSISDTFRIFPNTLFATLAIPCTTPIGGNTLRIRNLQPNGGVSPDGISDTMYFNVGQIPTVSEISYARYTDGSVPPENIYTNNPDLALCPGDSIILRAQTDGTHYLWYNNGVPMPGPNGVVAPHSVDSLIVTGTGVYTVEAYNGSCSLMSEDTAITIVNTPTEITFAPNDPANANVYQVDHPNPLIGMPADSIELCENETGFLEAPVPTNSGLTYTYQWLYDSVSTVTGLVDQYPIPGATMSQLPLNSNTLKLGTNEIRVEVSDGYCTDTTAEPYYVIVDSIPDAEVAGIPFPGRAGPTVFDEICMKDSVLLTTIPSLPDPDWKYTWEWYDPTRPTNNWRRVWPTGTSDPGLDTLRTLQLDTSLSEPGQPYYQTPKPVLRFFRVRIWTETTRFGTPTCAFFSDSVAVRWFPEYDLTLAPNQPNITTIGQDSITFCETETAAVQAPATPAYIDTNFPQYAYSYQWLTDSLDQNLGTRVKIPITGATNRTFNIDSSGNYFVVLNDGICTDTSGPFRAFVDTVPETSVVERLFPNGGNSLTNLNLCLYDSALVSATDTVLGLRPWDYQWQQFNPISGAWSNLAGETGVTLTIDTSLMRVDEDTAYFRLSTSYTNQFGVTNCGFITDSIEVVFYEAPELSYIPGDSVGICPGDSILFVAQGNFTSFSWQNGQVLGASRYINAPGDYPVEAIGVNGCVTLDTVRVYPLTVNASAGPDQTVRSGEEVELSASGGNSYRWFADEPLQFNDYLSQNITVRRVLESSQHSDTVTIYVEVTNQRGCTGIDSLRLFINSNIPDELSDISRAYNIFTPNGDNLNDLWDLRELMRGDNCSIIIMNRWGSTVYEDENFSGQWSGVDNGGNELPDGTYYYVLECDGEIRMRNAVTIIRNQ